MVMWWMQQNVSFWQFTENREKGYAIIGMCQFDHIDFYCNNSLKLF